MEIRKDINGLDSLVYLVACVLTLGAVYLSRVIITTAIVRAAKQD
jgi:hypothetical protein